MLLNSPGRRARPVLLERRGLPWQEHASGRRRARPPWRV